MARTHRWEPTSFEGLHDKVSIFREGFTTALRTRISFASETPLGKYIDDELFSRIDIYIDYYKVWSIPSKRTQEDLVNLRTAKNDLLPVYHEVSKLIRNNPLATDTDLSILGLKPRPTGEQHPSRKSERLVAYRVERPVPGRLEFYFFDETGEHRRGKPDGQQSAEMLGGIFPTQGKVEHKDLTVSLISTKSPFFIDFEDADRGKCFYFSMRWLNTRAEKGPWTHIAYAIIP
jgi:hypothetical protein